MGTNPDPLIFTMPSDARMALFSELQNKGFLVFKIPMEDYYKLLLEYGLEKTSDNLPYENYINYQAAEPLSADDIKTLQRAQDYHLTDTGLQAFDIIVKAVAEQLQNSTQ